MRNGMLLKALLFALLGSCALAVAQERNARNEWWWDEGWWADGVLPETKNHPVATRELSYKRGDTEVPVFVARPRKPGRYPGVLFVHGRRGLDDWTRLHAVRLAARGFFVFARDLSTGRFIPQFPVEHDYQLEDDLNKGLDAMLTQPDLRGKKICTVGISRGGYYALKLAVTKQRQDKDIACYVAYYPAMQDPNAPEPAQVYQYAPEVDALNVPALIFVGEQEQYHRKRVIESSVSTLKARGAPVRFIEYPGVGRGFDFRGENVRTYADDLAAKDAMQRTAEFIQQHLGR